MDEKSCRLTFHHQLRAISEKGVNLIHMVPPEHADHVMVVTYCNALGNSISCMIWFSRVFYTMVPKENIMTEPCLLVFYNSVMKFQVYIKKNTQKLIILILGIRLLDKITFILYFNTNFPYVI